MSIAYDRALLAKQCADIIKTAKRVRKNLPWFDFVGRFMIERLIRWAKKVLVDNNEISRKEVNHGLQEGEVLEEVRGEEVREEVVQEVIA